MAARILYPTQDSGPTDWSEPNWSEADDNAKDQPEPIAGDTVIFTLNSGVIDMDEDSAVLAAFTLGGGTLDGNDGTQWELYVDGDVTYGAGTATDVALTQGTGNLAWNALSQPLLSLTSDTDETVTVTAPSYVKRYTGAGHITGAAQFLIIFEPSAVWWGTQVGAVGCGVYVIDPSAGPGNNITLTDVPFIVYSLSAHTLTMDANLSTGTGNLTVKGNGAGDSMTLDMVSYDLTCGTVTLGDNNSNGKGVIDFGSGDAAITEIVAGHADNRDNAVDFGTGTVAITNAFDSAGDVNVLTSGTCTITVPSITLDSNANNSTTWTLDGDTTLEGDLTVQETAGITTLNTDGNELTCSGDVAYADTPVITELNLTMTGDKTLAWFTTQALTSLTVASGATVMLTVGSYTKKYTGTGNLAGGAQVLHIWAPSAAWWGTQVGTVACRLSVEHTSVAPGNDVTIVDRMCMISTGSTHAITMDANLDTGSGALNVYGDGAGDSMTFDMAGYKLTCGLITIGATAANTGNGKAYFGEGTIVCAGMAAGNAANLGNELNLESCYLEITGGGTADLDNIAADCDEGACHIEGLGAATVSNTDAVSTADGAPVKDNGTSTVTVDDDIFNSDMVGRQLKFDTSSNEYAIASYTNTKVVVVTGDASGEDDGDTVTVSNVNALVHTHHCTDGGSNNETTDAEVTFDTHISPAGINAAMAAAA